jgi:hypothetical protein
VSAPIVLSAALTVFWKSNAAAARRFARNGPNPLIPLVAVRVDPVWIHAACASTRGGRPAEAARAGATVAL